jgi:hypothetical protein
LLTTPPVEIFDYRVEHLSGALLEVDWRDAKLDGERCDQPVG